MPHRFVLFAFASLAASGCHIEHFGSGDDIVDDDIEPCTPEDAAHPPDAQNGDGGGPLGCSSDADCDVDFVCDVPSASCVPAPAPTCADLETESECSLASECTPVYAGVDCSCGPDCVCVGGEPGCICEAFQFFACADAPAR
jgi:hypothetical protein